jgi:hypothetical protein
MTAMGNGTATGEVKAGLLAGWPRERLLQISSGDKGKLALTSITDAATFESVPANADSAKAVIKDFNPDVILYRIAPKIPWLHEFAMDVIQHLNRPLVTWLMDDWPEDLAQSGAEEWKVMSADLASLLDRSALRLSICDAMSRAYQERYGMSFKAFANGVNPVEWPAVQHHETRRLLLRYSGGLAANMSLDSVLRIARVVELLAQKGYDISLEINTHTWWHNQSKDLFKSFKHTAIETFQRSPEEYRAWLSEADVAVIAYNFDENTHRYVRYSMANKMPECLASGAVVFAHGPLNLATIYYLASTEAAVVVKEPSEEAVASELITLLEKPHIRNKLARQGRKIAFARHNLIDLREELRSTIVQASNCGGGVKAISCKSTNPSDICSAGVGQIDQHKMPTVRDSGKNSNSTQYSLSKINQMVRSGAYSEAITEYITLWSSCPPNSPITRICSFNALYAARKSGITYADTMESLIEQVRNKSRLDS